MTSLITSISVTDFRSIQGTVTIPLEAPVVLLHGPNGAGKTSILSAIELALTGDVPAMRRADPAYQEHLVHRGAQFCRIVLAATGVQSSTEAPAEIIVRRGQIQGRPFLDGDARRFFSERCYLAQSTLTRLLEIYQSARGQEDSPLTRFVKDLLGLDQLESLIDGLHAVGDIRNVRRLVPEFADAEKERDAARTRLSQATQSLIAITSDIESTLAATREVRAGTSAKTQLLLPDSIEARLEAHDTERELVAISGYRRDLMSLRERTEALMVSDRNAEQKQAEREERDAATNLKTWWSTTGERVEVLIDTLREVFPDLPSVASTGPELAHRTALGRVVAEISRCQAAIVEDDALSMRMEQIGRMVEQSRSRIAIVEEQFDSIAGEAEGLSRALAALVPYIHDENCPLCGRDFSETSAGLLVQHASAQVAKLSEQADRLKNLSETRLEATNDLKGAERELDTAKARRLSQEAREGLKAHVADLSEWKTRLDDMVTSVVEGADLMRRDAVARKRLSEIRSRDRVAIEIRAALNDLCVSLEQVSIQESEGTIDAIKRLEAHALDRLRNLAEAQARRRQALEQLRRLRILSQDAAKLREAIAGDASYKARQEAAIETAEATRQSAKAVVKAAVEARTAIVGRVFNSALNKVWRDLFVRLAPTEPFVPAFHLPTTLSEPVTARLETLHRDGGAGGAPGAMLSAGNLNTAALTLFLALHLSVSPRLPWLILDDPVQSMDEVHISQFAALLRTLSKELTRQIVIAVHDRPLFDYLSLELSPAFPGDRLVTVELSRSASGTTFAEPNFRIWEPDRAIAA